MTQTATVINRRDTDMSSVEAIIDDYRDRLDRATSDLPAGRRAELLDDIDAHLAEATLGAPYRAGVLQVLDELGTPEGIAEAARAESGISHRRGVNGDVAYDVLSVLLLLFGGFLVPVVGWLAGVIMIWNGPRWTLADRWIATLAWPAAIAPLAALFIAIHANLLSQAASVVVLLCVALFSLALLVVPVIHLLRVAARRRS